MPKVVSFVPIKLNNERLPNKNIKKFTNGNPLIYYILDTLLKVRNSDEIYVYCSNEEILKYIHDPSIKFLKRKEYLDSSSISFNEVLSSFARDVNADIYVLSHATSPFLKPSSIELGIEKVMDGYDSALGVKKVQEFLWRDGQPLNYDLNNIPRTQDLPGIYAETCGMYIYNRDLIINRNRRVGEKPFFVELSKLESIDINDKEDFIVADALFNSIN
ncbi:acylneuraminate cytidylyltransferase family protein [Paenibacillus motobuensis]|uniref:HAD family hydrolase n=1 Tax=Paenibacillus motobuensis TaxID=295324 RepID=A0ABP3HS22_9BACL